MITTDLIGTTEAAKLLGLSRAGLLRRVEEGRLTPLASIGPRRIKVFDRSAIEREAVKE